MANLHSHDGSAAVGILKLPTALRRDLVLLVAVKVALLAILYSAFFSPSHQSAVDAMAHIAGEPRQP